MISEMKMTQVKPSALTKKYVTIRWYDMCPRTIIRYHMVVTMNWLDFDQSAVFVTWVNSSFLALYAKIYPLSLDFQHKQAVMQKCEGYCVIIQNGLLVKEPSYPGNKMS